MNADWITVGYWLYVLFFTWVLMEGIVWLKDWWRYERRREQLAREARERIR